MLKSAEKVTYQGIEVETYGNDLDSLLEREWLLTNSRGGFASGTLAGCNTRRYHSLLTGSLNPPANRFVSLANCFESIKINNKNIDLSTLEFDNKFHPLGFNHIKSFKKDIGVHFEYDLDFVDMTKSIYLLPDHDATAIVYEFIDVEQEFEFSLRPLTALRDFHGLQKSYSNLFCQWESDGLLIKTADNDKAQLFIRSDNMWFEQIEQWWYNFLYRKDKQRGQDCYEDLYSPGVFKAIINQPCRIVLWAAFGEDKEEIIDSVDLDIEVVIDSLALSEKELGYDDSPKDDKKLNLLYSAAGQFVAERWVDDKVHYTILAGYPWFLDWGRDTFISLEGILLCPGRYKEAANVLATFAKAVDQGMIPNRFDDYQEQAHYNSIDSSLWYVHAAFRYLEVTQNDDIFEATMLQAITNIINAYNTGTRFDIGADVDGLIKGGSEKTQLTWMDAKFADTAFTPRYGKAVEINALWYEALCNLAKYYENKDVDSHMKYQQMAMRVKKSFEEVFWNGQKGCLNDCVLPDGTVDSSIRPNQIFAVSLKYSPINDIQQKMILDTVQKHLLTPYGLRSLSPSDIRYCPNCIGSQLQRDSAYHQGTVWAFLVGPFVEAWLNVHGHTKKNKKEAADFISPLLEHLVQTGCLGSVSEIFDGDPPHSPRGCFAQAWSVAELIRAYHLINF